MRSYTLVPHNVQDGNSLTIPKVFNMNGWQSYDAILAELNKFDCHTFSVWQHPEGIMWADGAAENQPPTLLANCTYVGELATVMGGKALQFTPDVNCSDDVCKQVHDLHIRQTPKKEASFNLMKLFNDRLVATTNAELLNACRASKVLEVHYDSLCMIKYPDTIGRTQDILLLADGSHLDVWQRLRQLASANLNTMTVFTLEQNANGFTLHKVVLTPKAEFIRDVQVVNANSVAREQDQQYLASRMEDLFGARIDGSSETCQRNLNTIYDIAVDSINIDTQIPQQVAENVVDYLTRLFNQRIEQASEAALALEAQQEAASLAAIQGLQDDVPPARLSPELPRANNNAGNIENDDEINRALAMSLQELPEVAPAPIVEDVEDRAMQDAINASLRDFAPAQQQPPTAPQIEVVSEDDDEEMHEAIARSLRVQTAPPPARHVSRDVSEEEDLEFLQALELSSRNLDQQPARNNAPKVEEDPALVQALQQSSREALKPNCTRLLALIQDSKWETTNFKRPAVVKECIKYLKACTKAKVLPDEQTIIGKLKGFANAEPIDFRKGCTMYQAPETTRKFVAILKASDSVDGLLTAMQGNDRPAPLKRGKK